MRHHVTARAALLLCCGVVIAGWSIPGFAQLSADWMIPAAASNAGARNTFWRTDLSLHNPHEYDLPVVVQALPSNTDNSVVPTLTLTLSPWETVNLPLPRHLADLHPRLRRGR